MKKIYISNYYISDNPSRQKELDYCLKSNIESNLFDEIVLVVKKGIAFESDDNRIKYIIYEERPTFEYFFKVCNRLYDNQLCILSNLDIIFDKTINHIDRVDFDNTLIALSRHEKRNNKWQLYNSAECSQDTWIFKPKLPVDKMYCDFYLGRPGCDNRIAHELNEHYQVINPSKSIITYHVHDTNYRTYRPGSPTQTIPKPYKILKPTQL